MYHRFFTCVRLEASAQNQGQMSMTHGSSKCPLSAQINTQKVSNTTFQQTNQDDVDV